jgi:hypothetical protein
VRARLALPFAVLTHMMRAHMNARVCTQHLRKHSHDRQDLDTLSIRRCRYVTLNAGALYSSGLSGAISLC